MTNRSKIVPFEDARRSSRRARNDEWAMYGSSPAKSKRAKSTRKDSSDEKRRASHVQQAAKADARDAKKRKKAKERASKQFDRQYAVAAAGAAGAVGGEAAAGAPRAALYKGKMGASQRKSARMQRASQAEPVSAKLNPAGWFSRLNLSSRTAKLVTTAICAVLICAFLYTPAQQYYQAVRENERLEVEYAAVSNRNTALDEHNNSLASDAGMEDAVRQKYGYIIAGEQTAIVTGLSDEVDQSKKQNAQVEANVLSSSVKAPEQWYTPILDAVFGVE